MSSSMSRLALCAAFGMTVTRGVRITEMEDQDNQDDPEYRYEDCTIMMQALLKQSTWSDVMSPVMDGTYAITQGTTYLSVVDGGLSARGTDLGGANNHWVIKRLKWDFEVTSMPVWTVENEETGKYLSMNKNDQGLIEVGIKDECQDLKSMWHVHLDLNTFELTNAEFNLKLSSGEGLFAGTDFGQSDDTTHWSMEPTEKLGSRKREKALWQQWDVVKDTPFIKSATGWVNPNGSTLTWEYVCPGEKCYSAYAMSRDRLVALERIDESDRNYVTESRLTGMCDWTIDGLQGLLKNRPILHELQFQAQNEKWCPMQPLVHFARNLRDALMNECFNSCADTIERVFANVPCAADGEHDSLFVQAANESEQCAMMVPDNFDALADWVISKKCQKFPAPEILGFYHDHGHGTVEEEDDAAACQVPHYAAPFLKSKDGIKRHGPCPSGTACDCPGTWDYKMPDTSQIRSKAPKSSYIGKGAAHMSTLLGIGVSTFKTRFQLSFVTANIMPLIQRGALATTTLASIAALASGMPIIMGVTMGVVMSVTRARGAWRCAHDAGCWPQMPKMTQGKCRIPESAKEGHSKVWFLPPPGMQVRRKFFRKCVLEGCDLENDFAQTVGFSSDQKNVYNCQPMNFERMTPAQRINYIDAIAASGMEQEYDLAPARAATEE